MTRYEEVSGDPARLQAFIDTMNQGPRDDYVYTRAQLADAVEKGRVVSPEPTLATTSLARAISEQSNL